MKNLLREKLLKGEKTVGTFFESGSAILAECLGLAGMDYMIVDTEHGPFETQSVMEFVCAAERRGITPLVRVKDCSRPAILKNLDVGAKGLIIPCINTLEEVKKIVEYGKYYPLGLRGVCHARGSGFGYDAEETLEAYFENRNQETLLIPQCETRGCLEAIEEIVRLPGVDGIFVGPYDLSTALGKPGRFSDPEVTAAVSRVLCACKAAGKFSFIYAGDGEAASARFKEGFESVAVNMDTVIYIEAFKRLKEEALK